MKLNSSRNGGVGIDAAPLARDTSSSALALTKASTAIPAAILPVFVTVTWYTRAASSPAAATACVLLTVLGGLAHAKPNAEYDRPNLPTMFSVDWHAIRERSEVGRIVSQSDR